MLQKEFEERIGRKVERCEFEEANRIYMACGEMDKDEFCRHYTTKEGKQELLEVMAHEMRTMEKAKNLELGAKNREIADLENSLCDTADVLLGKACVYDDTDLYEMVVRMIGKRNVVMRKIEMGLPLWDEEKDLLRTALARCEDEE